MGDELYRRNTQKKTETYLIMLNWLIGFGLMVVHSLPKLLTCTNLRVKALDLINLLFKPLVHPSPCTEIRTGTYK